MRHGSPGMQSILCDKCNACHACCHSPQARGAPAAPRRTHAAKRWDLQFACLQNACLSDSHAQSSRACTCTRPAAAARPAAPTQPAPRSPARAPPAPCARCCAAGTLACAPAAPHGLAAHSAALHAWTHPLAAPPVPAEHTATPDLAAQSVAAPDLTAHVAAQHHRPARSAELPELAAHASMLKWAAPAVRGGAACAPACGQAAVAGTLLGRLRAGRCPALLPAGQTPGSRGTEGAAPQQARARPWQLGPQRGPCHCWPAAGLTSQRPAGALPLPAKSQPLHAAALAAHAP